MGENAANQGAASFDGIIKGWPEDQSISVSVIPTDRKAFLRYMTCELFKNQNITDPRKQALNSFDYANSLYGVLASNGLMD